MPGVTEYLKHAEAVIQRAVGQYIGLPCTDFTKTMVVNTVQAYLDEITSRSDSPAREISAWIQITVESDPNDAGKLRIVPSNLFTAMLLAGVKDPPRKAVVVSELEYNGVAWALVGGDLVLREI